MTNPIFRVSLAGALVLAPLTACSGPQQETEAVDHAEIAESIKADVQTIVQAFDERDAEKGVSLNAPDFVQMFHGQPKINNAEDLEFTKTQLADPAVNLSVSDEEVEVAEAGDMALYTARYDYTFTDPDTGEPATEQGNWVMVFKRQSDGSMKIYREIISDLPASNEEAG